MSDPIAPGRVVRLNGKWDLWLPEHRAAREEWTNTAGWERERLDSMHANLKPGDVVYDIGAEEGDFGGLFASWGCDVVLAEPNPRVWPNIRAIFEANDLTHAVKGCWVGLVGDITDDAHAPDEDVWPECAYGPVIGDHGFMSLADGRETCPQITLDDLVERTGVAPTALTLDVEGGECFVMQGAQHTLAEHAPLVWVSVHPEFMFGSHGQYQNELYTLLHQHGYVKHLLAHDHETHVVFWRPDVHTDFRLPCARHGYGDCG